MYAIPILLDDFNLRNVACRDVFRLLDAWIWRNYMKMDIDKAIEENEMRIALAMARHRELMKEIDKMIAGENK